jgi:hypothetical protein
MKLKLDVEINSGAAWLMSFITTNAYAVYTKVAFSEYWIAIAALYGWHSGRRLWKDIKLANGTIATAAEDPGAK